MELAVLGHFHAIRDYDDLKLGCSPCESLMMYLLLVSGLSHSAGDSLGLPFLVLLKLQFLAPQTWVSDF